MRTILLAACSFSLGGCTTLASSFVTAYGPQTVMTAGGYRDWTEGPGRWRVSAKANGMVEQDFAQHMAVFRGAVLAKAAGFSYLQIVSFRGRQRMVGGMRGIQDVTFRFAGAHEADAPLACESPPLTQSSCRTVGVDATLALLGPALNQSPAQIEAEVAAARASPPRAS
ncbi:MAG TPA: hypothetical protein VEX35_03900 [Allosphingosinicella sp.]|nr:hypothetical protein [Allosphingosinicella sp.]